MDVPGSFVRASRVKNFGQALEFLKINKHFDANIHDPNARTSMTPRRAKKLRAEKLRVDVSFPRYIQLFGTSYERSWVCPTKSAVIDTSLSRNPL